MELNNILLFIYLTHPEVHANYMHTLQTRSGGYMQTQTNILNLSHQISRRARYCVATVRRSSAAAAAWCIYSRSLVA